MRLKQWYKNFVLFAGIIFSLNFFNTHIWITVLFAFITFYIVSGSEYIIYDIVDKETGKIYPKKRSRPIASGKLNTSYALIFVVTMLCVALLGAYLINIHFLEDPLAYFIFIFLHSLILKNIVVVDVLTISSSFVLRPIAGCLAINVSAFIVLILCTFLPALFLAFEKRRLYASKKIRIVLVDLLSIQKEIYKRVFAYMDGEIWGNWADPRTMVPYIGNPILTSDDHVAIDSATAKIMGFEPLKIGYIRIANDIGLR